VRITISLTELLPSVHALPRGDKFRLMQELIAELAGEESGAAAQQAAVPVEYPVWSPHDAHEAAATLLQLLDQDRREQAEASPVPAA